MCHLLFRLVSMMGTGQNDLLLHNKYKKFIQLNYQITVPMACLLVVPLAKSMKEVLG